MKKIFLFSLGMLLSLTAGMVVSQIVIAEESEDWLAEIFSNQGLTMSDSTDSTELKTLASQSEAPFAGLYLFMLQNIKDGPKDAAIKEIAKRYKYTEEEIEAIVIRGETTGIINKRQAEFAAAQEAESAAQMEEASAQGSEDVETFVSENEFGDLTEEYIRWYYEEYEKVAIASELQDPVTSEFLLMEFAAISEAYDKELEFQQSNRRLAYEALASEMFMNNELSDSANVDLLYDLDLIHYLLFGEFITYPDRSDENVDLASEEEPLELFRVPEPREKTETEPEVVLAADSIDPYVCYGDEDLASALTAFENDPPDTGDALPESSSEIDYSINKDKDSPGSSHSGSSSDDDSDEDETDSGSSSGSGSEVSNPYLVDIGAAFQDLDEFLSSLEAPKGNWSRNYACDETFCIEVLVIAENGDAEVEENNMEADDFEENENCIACHTAYIKERLEETMSKSLVPSKISMNWFEDATCKEAGTFVNLDLNVYAIKKPIDLDPGDDLDEKANEDIETFMTTLSPLIGINGGTLGKTKDEQECQSILNLTKAAKVERSIDELLQECQWAVAENAAQIQEVFDEFKFETYSQTTSDLYGQVSAELYTMLLYFKTFKENLKETYELGQAPLASLINDKQYCQ